MNSPALTFFWLTPYLKAFKSYPIFKVGDDDDDDDDDNDDNADTIGGWIIVCAEFLILSQTKKKNLVVFAIDINMNSY